MRILVITQFFPPDITAAAFRMADTLTHVVARGHEVHVLTAEPHKAQVDEKDGSGRIIDKVGVSRCKLAEVGKGGFRRYVTHYLSFTVGSVWSGIKLRISGWKPDVIWASSPPLFVGLSGRILAMLFGCPLVLDIRDIWPDSAVSAGQISEGGRAFKIGKRLEKYLYDRADSITCVASPMRDYIATKTKRPISILYNGVSMPEEGDLVAVPPAGRNGGENTVLYAGNLGRVQALDMILRAFAELEKESSLGPWKLRMIGAGALGPELTRLAKDLGIEKRASIEPPMTRDAVSLEMQKAALLFLSLKPDAVLRMTIPSKVFDYLLAARPIVAGIVGEGQGILESTGANVCYDPESLEALKGALVSSFKRFDDLASRAPGNRSLVLNKFTREQGAETLIGTLESAIQTRKTGR